MSPDSIPRQVVNTVLRANLPFFAIACVCLLAGICALLLARRRSRDRLLVWVGVFSILYATRLFVQNELVRDAFNAPGPGFLPWALCITYGINIPYALFARELFGRGWKGTIATWLWISVAFAAVATPAAFFYPQAHWTGLLNGVLVLGGTTLVLIHVLMARRMGGSLAASLLWPLVIFCLVVVLENLGVRPGGFDIEPIGFLILLAGLASIGARRAFLTERKLIEVEQELSTARQIQRSIIPHVPPDVPSINFATRYRPMSAVAGDFYDFMKPSDRVFTILVADVSGHGVPAALVASMLKVCFAAQRDHGDDPASVLSGLNVMMRDSLGGQYITAACAAIDVEARVITYAGAGHPPSLLLRTERGEIVHLAENGLFIGPFPTASYTNMAVDFHIGDKLLLYTDGIIEANGADGEEFGRERLEQLLVKTANQLPTAFINALFEEISHGAQCDDLTAVVAQFC